jgi:G3E family GTPase
MARATMSATYITVGGFLGAGKTTAMVRLAELLSARGLRVGLITNDQSRGLVDTATVTAGGFAVREITDGCFCCRFGSLVDAAESLTLEVRPEVFLAEPVGSCTDLRATVQLPLARLYGDAYRVAPLSVLVDPLRAARAFGVDPGPSFSSRVLYIYDKQLEEADLLVLNKIDIIPAQLRLELEATLARRYPNAEIVSVSARTGTGIEAWLEQLLATPASAARPTMDVDYDLYADGESLLGWVNATFMLRAERDVDGNRFFRRLADALRERLAAATVEIAHLKMTLATGDGGDRATINVVRSDGSAELARRLSRPLREAELTVNLRAEDDPGRLHALLMEAVTDVGREAEVEALLREEAHFRPGRPVPTHRMVAT